MTASVVTNQLRVTGDGASDAITLRLNAGNTTLLEVVQGTVVIGTFVRATFTSMAVDGGGGNDVILFDETSGGVTTTTTITILGGDGDDTITGGSGAETISGGPGNDTLLGRGGADIITGDAGNDTITGGDADDTVNGGANDDRIIWNPGDDTDVADGLSGIDTLVVNGGNGAEAFTVMPNGVRVRFDRVTPAPFSIDCGTIERLEMNGNGGDDTLDIAAGLDGLLDETVVDMGFGVDAVTTTATSGRVTVNGGDGADTVAFNALNQLVDVQPSSIRVGGIARLTHSAVETVTVSNTVTTLPVVTITSPTAAATTTATSSFIALGGTASDLQGVTAVTWTNDRGGSGTASGTTTWSIPEVALQGGVNLITVSALDTSGNRTSDALAVTVGPISYSLSEGATGTFFDLDVLIANPNLSAAPATVTYLREDGTTLSQNLNLAASSRTTLHVDQISGLENVGGVSTVVTSTTGVPLVVERTMFWDASYYGSHGGTAVDGPRTRWLFAEGSEGFFNTFVLLANSGLTPSTVTLTFLRENSTPFVRTVNVPATSRVTVATNGIPELVGQSFSIIVDATVPILAERAMYFGTARIFDGGHESAGVPAGSTSWFLAEGATGPYFETFVLVGNPNPAVANVTMTFLTDGGQTVVRNKTVSANGRLTVNIETEDPLLANAAVSTTITSNQPVVAERAMYWPGPPTTWAEAHNSFGATTLATRWGLAEGRVGQAHAFQTYILLANPNASAANVRITFLRVDGTTVVKTFTVNPTSRFNVAVNTAAPELVNENFGAVIEVTNAIPISVERAMYSDALGQVWAAGTNALGTRLP